MKVGSSWGLNKKSLQVLQPEGYGVKRLKSPSGGLGGDQTQRRHCRPLQTHLKQKTPHLIQVKGL